jgi:hypothetical protein
MTRQLAPHLVVVTGGAHQGVQVLDERWVISIGGPVQKVSRYAVTPS